MTEMPVASPCVRNCCLDDEDVCLGCHRTVTEIMAWGSAGNAERRVILARAAERVQQRSMKHPSKSKA